MRSIGLIGVIGAGLAVGCGPDEGGDDAFVGDDDSSTGTPGGEEDESSSAGPTTESGPMTSTSTTSSTTEPNADDDNGDTNPPAGCDNLSAEGTAVGQVPPDFELVDQNGQVHSLHEHCGKVILLTGGAEW